MLEAVAAPFVPTKQFMAALARSRSRPPQPVGPVAVQQQRAPAVKGAVVQPGCLPINRGEQQEHISLECVLGYACLGRRVPTPKDRQTHLWRYPPTQAWLILQGQLHAGTATDRLGVDRSGSAAPEAK